MKFWSMLILKSITLILGLYLFYFFAREISWQKLYTMYQSAGWILLLPLWVYSLTAFFHTLGLYFLIKKANMKSGDFFRLYCIRMAADSINKITPFIDIGGEPLKVFLLVKHGIANLKSAVVSVWVARIGFVFSEFVFVIVGLSVLHLYAPSSSIELFVFIGLLVTSVYLVILVFSQMKGAVRVVPIISKAWIKHPDQIGELHRKWGEVDSVLKSYYFDNKGSFLRSCLAQLIGWTITTIETYLFVTIMGYKIGWMEAFIFQSLLQVLKTATFFIPGNLGAQEGGMAILAAHLGFDAALGFGLSLYKRFRQFLWTLIGFIIWKSLGVIKDL